MSIFEQASREKTRFQMPGTGSNYTVEDLWDLPLQSTASRANLDAIAIALSTELEKTAPKSFVDTSATSATNAGIRLKLDIVLHVIRTKMAENANAAELAAARKNDQIILGAIADRERAELLALPVDQLRARLSTAGGAAAPAATTEEA